jgi:hypothetical protein
MDDNEHPALRAQVRAPSDLLAVLPRLFGFVPERSLVVVGVRGDQNRFAFASRYDLPPVNDARDIAEHATARLTEHHITWALPIGYGTGPEVTPAMDAFRDEATRAHIALLDALRVDEGRYWSYVCDDPVCHPVEGTPLEGGQTITPEMLDGMGTFTPGGRQALAERIAPVQGAEADEMRAAYWQAAAEYRDLRWRGGDKAALGAGRDAVREAVTATQTGSQISSAEHARLGVAMTDIRLRDDAWARMDREFAAEHSMLWSEATRRAPEGYAAAPASLLGFTEAQRGNGAMANVALDRALADQPGYSMAHLVRQ